jgi:hypothetical protein
MSGDPVRRLRERIVARSEYERSEEQAQAKLYADLILKHVDSLEDKALDEVVGEAPITEFLNEQQKLKLAQGLALTPTEKKHLLSHDLEPFQDLQQKLLEHGQVLPLRVPLGEIAPPQLYLHTAIQRELQRRTPLDTGIWSAVTRDDTFLETQLAFCSPLRPEPTEAAGAGAVYIDGFLAGADLAELERLCQTAGTVTDIEFVRDLTTGKERDAATCQYTTTVDAAAAVERLNGQYYRGRKLRVMPIRTYSE